MDSFTFGSPDAQNQITESTPAQVPVSTSKGVDILDSATSRLRADDTTGIYKFLKRFIPVVIFIITCIFGVGLGRTDMVSNCIQGIYGEISLFFGVVTIPLYNIPEVCFYPDKAQDFMSIRPFVFLISLIVVFAIWSYFDRKLVWRDRGNYQTF